jgi:hypothetical protein
VSRWAARALLILTPLSLFALAFAVRAMAAGNVPFPATEPSAFYVGVARNLVEGRGLVTDTLFSYATPPLAVPRPAFELWQPLAAFFAAGPMALLGATFANAQLSSLFLGSLVAPFTWFIALDVALRENLSDLRAFLIALSSGTLAAVLAPLLIADVSPESTTAFTLMALLSCWMMTRALPGDGMTIEEANRGRVVPRLLLGVLLGLAYLARHEAIYLVPAYLILLVHALGPMRGAFVRAVLPTFIGGVVVVIPWLVRNFVVFGSPFPGSVVELALLTRNEQLFSYVDRPTAAVFFSQEATLIAGRILQSLWRNLVTDLLIPAMPVGLIGLASIVALRNSAAVGAPRALRALLISGLLTFVVTSVVFPVASAWGTYRHAAGPFLVGLIIMTALGLDAFVARVRRRRRWPRANAWLAPAFALAVAVPLATLHIQLLGAQVREFNSRLDAARVALLTLEQSAAGSAGSGSAGSGSAGTGTTASGPIISDQPVRLSEALRRTTIVLPDEQPAVVWQLARRFQAPDVVILGERGRYPGALLRDASAGCFGTAAVVPMPGSSAVYAFPVTQGRCGSVGSR